MVWLAEEQMRGRCGGSGLSSGLQVPPVASLALGAWPSGRGWWKVAACSFSADETLMAPAVISAIF